MKEGWWKPALVFYAKVTGWILVPLLAALYIVKRTASGHSPLVLIGVLFGSFAISVFGILSSAKSVKEFFNKK